MKIKITRKYGLPLLAAFGFIIMIIVVILDNQPKVSTQSVNNEPKIPFSSYVAGNGMVEAGTRNILIGTPVAGVVKTIDVQPGEKVKVGQPLFNIDDRAVEAQLIVAKASVTEAQVNLDKAEHKLTLFMKLLAQHFVAVEDVNDLRYAVQEQKALLGAANAQVSAIELQLSQYTIDAPIDAQVLRINTNVGEFAQAGELATPLMILGADQALQVRVDIDEDDAWRIRAGAPAIAFFRSNPNLEVPLSFKRIEPYIVPKTALAGGSTERVDTRTLQMIYTIQANNLPLYAGQLLDVYIQAAPIQPNEAGT